MPTIFNKVLKDLISENIDTQVDVETVRKPYLDSDSLGVKVEKLKRAIDHWKHIYEAEKTLRDSGKRGKYDRDVYFGFRNIIDYLTVILQRFEILKTNPDAYNFNVGEAKKKEEMFIRKIDELKKLSNELELEVGEPPYFVKLSGITPFLNSLKSHDGNLCGLSYGERDRFRSWYIGYRKAKVAKQDLKNYKQKLAKLQKQIAEYESEKSSNG